MYPVRASSLSESGRSRWQFAAFLCSSGRSGPFRPPPMADQPHRSQGGTPSRAAANDVRGAPLLRRAGSRADSKQLEQVLRDFVGFWKRAREINDSTCKNSTCLQSFQPSPSGARCAALGECRRGSPRLVESDLSPYVQHGSQSQGHGQGIASRRGAEEASLFVKNEQCR